MHLSLMSSIKAKVWIFLSTALALLCLSLSATSHGEESKLKPSYSNEATSLTLNVNYNKTTDSHHAKNEEYFIELLELALKKSGALYKTTAILLENQTEGRGAELLANGVFDVHWLNTSIALEDKLSPIRIPLFKGLVGWRIFVIRKSAVDTYEKISTLEQLKRLSPLQGNDWPDTKILMHNGFAVETAREFRSLQRMLKHGRGDFFPRSLIEVWGELENHTEGDFAIDEHLAIRYSAAYYFFVNKENTRLKNTLEKGLNIAIADGSFDALFFRYFGNAILKSHLKSRLIFDLSNPFLPRDTLTERKELWFDLESFPE